MRPTLRIAAPSLFAFALAAGCAGKVVGSEPDGGSSSGSASGGSGSSGGPGPDTCASSCTHIVQLACMQPPETQTDCESSCDMSQTLAEMKGCSGQFASLLACIDHVTLTCNPQGQLDSSVCQAAIVALETCTNPPPPPPPGCEAIPPRTGLSVTCSTGGVSGGGDTMTSCTDGSGHTWSAQCAGASCSCGYDGKVLCQCVTDGGASSCCPGV